MRRSRRWRGVGGVAGAHGGASSASVARVNVTPMIDVVMVLIVFFLLVGHLANERRGAVDLPAATQGEDEDGTRRPVVVLVRTAGDVRVDGVGVGDADLGRAISAGVESRRRAGRFGGVHVRADAGIAYDAVRPVLEACREAGVGEVRLAVRPEWAE
ncbi:MAG: biopolymer transporter ExbD [Planctomycetota bacterium]